jgi:phosphoglycolate phosphatase
MNHDFGAIAAVAFDLDGTLVDSVPDIGHALNSALKSEGLRRFDIETVRVWIGDGPDVLIERALAAQGVDSSGAAARAVRDNGTRIDPRSGTLVETAPNPRAGALHTRLRRAFDMATLAAPMAEGTVFAGIAELVEGLHRVLPMLVVTNKPTPLARAVLAAANLLPYLHSVRGADTPQQRKPSPSTLLAAADSLGIPPSRLLMVGDSGLDVLAAQAAGCPCALVAWGYGHDAVPPHLPVHPIATPRQLLDELLRARRSDERVDGPRPR